MSEYLIQQIGSKSNITVELDTRVHAVSGSARLHSVWTRKSTTADVVEHSADAMYIMIGAEANTNWLPDAVQRDNVGFVLTGRNLEKTDSPREGMPPFHLETSLPGFFCAGDVRHGSVKRVASAVGEGSIAISLIHQYLSNLRVSPRDRTDD